MHRRTLHTSFKLARAALAPTRESLTPLARTGAARTAVGGSPSSRHDVRCGCGCAGFSGFATRGLSGGPPPPPPEDGPDSHDDFKPVSHVEATPDVKSYIDKCLAEHKVGVKGGWRTPLAYNSHCPASPLWPAGAPSGWPKRRTSTCVGRAHLTGLATLIRQEPHVQGCGGHPHTARGARHQDPAQKKWVLGLKGFGGVHYKGSIQRTPGQAPNPSIHHPTGLTPWTNKRGPEWTLQPTSPARSRTATLIISTVCWMAGVFVHEGEPAGAAMRLQQHSGARAAGESSFSFSSSPPPSFQLSAHKAVGFMRRTHQGTKPSETEEE